MIRQRYFEDKVTLEGEEVLEVLKGDQVHVLFDAFEAELEDIDEIDKEFAKGIMKKVQKKTGIKGKNLYMPIRIALTGNMHGPELVNIIYILGKDKITDRIKYIKEKYLI